MQTQKEPRKQKKILPQTEVVTSTFKASEELTVAKISITDLLKESIPVRYTRFHHAISPIENKEPVFEFRLSSDQKKYVVDAMYWTSDGLIWTVKGETNICPLANIVFCRFIV